MDRRYFVYMLQTTSRHALYLGFTNFLIARAIEHRTRKYPNSFSAKYRTWRLVYYEEFGDAEAAHNRERQLKGWSRAKNDALIVKMNPRWRDLIAEWEEKYGLEFRLDGRIVKGINPPAKVKTKDPSTPGSRAGESAREQRGPRQTPMLRLQGCKPSCAQDGRVH